MSIKFNGKEIYFSNIINLWEEYDENYPNLNRIITLIDDIYEILNNYDLDAYNLMPLSLCYGSDEDIEDDDEEE